MVLSDYAALTRPAILAVAAFVAVGGMCLSRASIAFGLFVSSLAGIALVVASAGALNMYLERDTDRLMRRTESRPLPAGRMPSGTALAFGLMLGCAGLLTLGLFVNPLTCGLGAGALILYVLVYTPLKRITPAAFLIGAIPGAMPALMGWTAVTGSIGLPGLALTVVLAAWQIPHSIAISLYLKEDCARAGLRVAPLVHGDRNAKWQTLGYTLALIPVSAPLLFSGSVGATGLVMALSSGAALLLLAVQVARSQGNSYWPRRYHAGSLVYISSIILGIILESLALS